MVVQCSLARASRPGARPLNEIGSWASDTANNYVFDVNDSGYFGVSRLSEDKWEIPPLGDTETTALKQGLNQWNDVEVDLVGNRAIFFINGHRVGQVVGRPPSDGFLVGLYMQPPEKSLGTVQFRSFKITR